MAWQKGPLPPNTYQWGGVVPKGESTSHGFFFADFKGNHVIMSPGTPQEKRLEPEDVLLYNNSLTLPPLFRF